MHSVVATVEPLMRRPGTEQALREWAERAPEVEHLVQRERADGGIDLVVWVTGTSDVLAAVAKVIDALPDHAADHVPDHHLSS